MGGFTGMKWSSAPAPLSQDPCPQAHLSLLPPATPGGLSNMKGGSERRVAVEGGWHSFGDSGCFSCTAETGLTNLSVSRWVTMAGVVYPRQVSVVGFCPPVAILSLGSFSKHPGEGQVLGAPSHLHSGMISFLKGRQS